MAHSARYLIHQLLLLALDSSDNCFNAVQTTLYPPDQSVAEKPAPWHAAPSSIRRLVHFQPLWSSAPFDLTSESRYSLQIIVEMSCLHLSTMAYVCQRRIYPRADHNSHACKNSIPGESSPQSLCILLVSIYFGKNLHRQPLEQSARSHFSEICLSDATGRDNPAVRLYRDFQQARLRKNPAEDVKIGLPNAWYGCTCFIRVQ